MSKHSAENDVLANIREALDKIAKASRVIIVHPDHEASVRTAVAESPLPGLLSVTVSEECPKDRLFLIPTVIPPGSPTATTEATA